MNILRLIRVKTKSLIFSHLFLRGLNLASIVPLGKLGKKKKKTQLLRVK